MLDIKLVRKTKGAGLQGIIDRLPDAAKIGVEKATESTKQLAVKFSRGRVADGIEMKIEVVDANTFEVKGTVYTTSPFSAFLEWGTGKFMSPNPLGHIPGSAGDRGEPWFVHEDMADLSRYNFPTLQTPAGMYYIIEGTKPHPFMRTAAFENRDKNVQAVLDSLREMIKDVVR